MKRLSLLYMVLVGSSLLILAESTALAQAGSNTTDQPAVVSAFAPIYPPIARSLRAEGDVVVEVKIDAEGKVVAAKAISGHELLRKSSEATALRWQFSPLPPGPKERVARLVFGYNTINEVKPDDPEFLVCFKPPYRVEVKFNPPIID